MDTTSFVPENADPKFLDELNKGSKISIPKCIVQMMPQNADLKSCFCPRTIFNSLKEHPDFGVRLPAEYNISYSDWILDVLNSYTGGELLHVGRLL